MSMQCLKKKGVIQYGSNRSGKPPGGIWVPQGPFGNLPVEYKYGPKGFSLNGGHRNVGYVGKSMAMSKSGTPFWAYFNDINQSLGCYELGQCSKVLKYYKYLLSVILF